MSETARPRPPEPPLALYSKLFEHLGHGDLAQCWADVWYNECECWVKVTYYLQPNGQITYHPYIPGDPHAEMARKINGRGLGVRTDLQSSSGTVDAQLTDWILFANLGPVNNTASGMTISDDRLRQRLKAVGKITLRGEHAPP